MPRYALVVYPSAGVFVAKCAICQQPVAQGYTYEEAQQNARQHMEQHGNLEEAFNEISSRGFVSDFMHRYTFDASEGFTRRRRR